MSYYLAEIRFNKNKSDNSEKKKNKRKRLTLTLFTLILISLLLSASLTLFSVTACEPPEIINVTRTPEIPSYDHSTTITAKIIKGHDSIRLVILMYQIDSGSWFNATMRLEEEFFVANIPAQPYGTKVNYKVYASDEAGYSDVSELFSYVVGDFVPPVISNVNHVPSTPDPYEFVTVSAKVAEPTNASGVQKATLWFTAAGRWAPITMTYKSGLWTGRIPGLSQGAYVRYYIKAFDNAGNDAKTTIFDYSVTVLNVPPVSLFSSASTVYTGEVVDFNASASYDIDGYIVSYSWNFGDESTDSGIAVSHSYEENGIYNVTLTVTDDDGAIGSKTVTIAVKNRPPVAKISTSTTILDKEEIVTFDASESYDPDGIIVSYEWNFGDGTTATGITVSHSYPATGEYTVTLTVTDDDGAIDTAKVKKTVLNQGPLAAFTESAHTVDTDETIYFDASDSYDPDGIIISYSWDFGDGNTATGVEAEHAYQNSGTYTVTLTVTDNDGATDTVNAAKIILSKAPVPPVALFTENATVAKTDETIHFDASDSYDPDGTIVSYEWNLGDGTTGTGVETDHAYSEVGDFMVTLTLTDNDGATDLTADIITVEDSGIDTEIESAVPLFILSVIILGMTALTATILYGLFIRRKRRKKNQQ